MVDNNRGRRNRFITSTTSFPLGFRIRRRGRGQRCDEDDDCEDRLTCVVDIDCLDDDDDGGNRRNGLRRRRSRAIVLDTDCQGVCARI